MRPDLARVALRYGWPLSESWSDAARQAALIKRRERGKGALPVTGDSQRLRWELMHDQVVGNFSPAHNIMISEEMRPAVTDMTLHGGFGRHQAKQVGLRDGGKLNNPLGLSRNPAVADYFADSDGALFHVNVKKGHPVYDPTGDGGGNPYAREEEMVLPAGTSFKVDRVAHDGLRRHVYMTASAP